MAEHRPEFIKFNSPEENEKKHRKGVLKNLGEEAYNFVRTLDLGVDLPKNPTKEDVTIYINEFIAKAQEKLDKINNKKDRVTSEISPLGQQINITPLAGSERSEVQRASYYLSVLIEAFKEIKDYADMQQSIDEESVKFLRERNRNNLDFWSEVSPGIEINEQTEKRPFSITPNKDQEEQRKVFKEFMIINVCNKFLHHIHNS